MYPLSPISTRRTVTNTAIVLTSSQSGAAVSRIMDIRTLTLPNNVFVSMYPLSPISTRRTVTNTAIVLTSSQSGAAVSTLFKIAGAIRSSVTVVPAVANANGIQRKITLLYVHHARPIINPVFCHILYFGFFPDFMFFPPANDHYIPRSLCSAHEAFLYIFSPGLKILRQVFLSYHKNISPE